MLLPTLIKKCVLLTLDSLQLGVLAIHLHSLCLHGLSLRALIISIFAHETQTAIHLVEILGREDKHKFVLHRAVTRHIPHRLYVLVLPVLQLCLQRVELGVENAYVAIDMVNVFLYVVYVVLALVYLAVNEHEFIELFAHVLAVLFQGFLLFSDLFLDVCSLALQLLYRRIGICHRRAFLSLSRSGLGLLDRALGLGRALGFTCRRLLSCLLPFGLRHALRREHEKGEQYINYTLKTNVLHLHTE